MGRVKAAMECPSPLVESAPPGRPRLTRKRISFDPWSARNALPIARSGPISASATPLSAPPAREASAAFTVGGNRPGLVAASTEIHGVASAFPSTSKPIWPSGGLVRRKAMLSTRRMPSVEAISFGSSLEALYPSVW